VPPQAMATSGAEFRLCIRTVVSMEFPRG
jgi:hypothetical protein